MWVVCVIAMRVAIRTDLHGHRHQTAVLYAARDTGDAALACPDRRGVGRAGFAGVLRRFCAVVPSRRLSADLARVDLRPAVLRPVAEGLCHRHDRSGADHFGGIGRRALIPPQASDTSARPPSARQLTFSQHTFDAGLLSNECLLIAVRRPKAAVPLSAISRHSAFGHKPSSAGDCRSREMLVRDNASKGCGCTAQAARLPPLWVESGCSGPVTRLPMLRLLPGVRLQLCQVGSRHSAPPSQWRSSASSQTDQKLKGRPSGHWRAIATLKRSSGEIM